MLRRRLINPMVFVLILVLAVCTIFVPIPWWTFAILIFAWFIITLCGSFFVGWNYHLTSLNNNKQINHTWVSITFDDGPNSEFTPKVLRLLQAYGAKATFFCIGKQIEDHPDIVLQILAEGHSIGNHTYSHAKSFGFFSAEQVKAELKKTRACVRKLTHRQMKLYRPAFGVTNPQIEKAVKHLGLQSIGWSVRSLDTTSRSEVAILNRITTKVAKGDVILLHDTSDKTVAVLERLLVFLQHKNLQSVPVEQLLEIDAYD